jgi:uncharacterized membrane protein
MDDINLNPKSESDEISLRDEINDILSDPTIKENTKSKIKNILHIQTVTKSMGLSGPLPHPDILAAYDSIIKNGAERIMSQVETQSAHRILITNVRKST